MEPMSESKHPLTDAEVFTLGEWLKTGLHEADGDSEVIPAIVSREIESRLAESEKSRDEMREALEEIANTLPSPGYHSSYTKMQNKAAFTLMALERANVKGGTGE